MQPRWVGFFFPTRKTDKVVPVVKNYSVLKKNLTLNYNGGAQTTAQVIDCYLTTHKILGLVPNPT